jgi:HK97 family phage major capsid protein
MSIKELNEKRLALHKEVRAILDNATATKDDKVKADGLLVEMNSIAQDIERIKTSDAYEAELRKVDFKPESAVDGKKNDGKRSAEEQTELENRAFYKYCTRGRQSLTPEENAEIRAAESTTAGSGGDLIPPAFQRNLEIAMKYYAPFTEYADVFDTPDGAPMIWPLSTTVNRECQLVPEGSAVTDADITTAKTVFGAFKFGDLVKVGLEISQDSFTSVDGIVVDAFALSFGRGLSHKFTTGVGTTEPTGILTAATFGITSQGDDNATSPDPTTQIGYYDMLGLLHSVDPAYRNQPGAKWMFTDNTLLALQKLKDKFGHPLWQPSFSSEASDRILNKPYIINTYMPEIGTAGSPPTTGGGNKAVLFGDLSRYKVRRVKTMTIQRLVERYAEFGQVGLIAWARYDGNLLTADSSVAPVKYLVCGA